jgi:ferredoxin-NADP reductase
VSFAPPEFTARLVSRTPASSTVEVFEFEAMAGRFRPGDPGSHIDVVVPGVGDRQYSLLPSAPDRWRIGVLGETEGRGGSRWLHDSLAPGDTVRLRGPRNHFAFRAEAGARVVFLAAGVGITPFLGMIDAAVDAGADWELHYSGRARTTMAFVDELERAHADRVHVHVSDASTRLDLAALFESLPSGVEVFACGPAHYLDAVDAASGNHSVHAERFVAKELGEPVWSGPFEVELANTGDTLTVPPERSVLEVLEEAGVFVLSSCREGTCGTCETTVLEGEVDHRDSILTPAERAQNFTMYPCVSRAACPRLVLDL